MSIQSSPILGSIRFLLFISLFTSDDATRAVRLNTVGAWSIRNVRRAKTRVLVADNALSLSRDSAFIYYLMFFLLVLFWMSERRIIKTYTLHVNLETNRQVPWRFSVSLFLSIFIFPSFFLSSSEIRLERCAKTVLNTVVFVCTRTASQHLLLCVIK